MSVMDKKLYIKDSTGSTVDCNIYTETSEVGSDYLSLNVGGTTGYVKLGEISNPNATLGRVSKGETTYAICKSATITNKYFFFDPKSSLAWNRYTYEAESVTYPTLSYDGNLPTFVLNPIPDNSGYSYATYSNDTATTQYAVRSKDFKTWEYTQVSNFMEYSGVLSIRYCDPMIRRFNNTLFKAGTEANVIFYSEDGVNWNRVQTSAGFSNPFYQIAYYNGEYYVVHGNYGNNKGVTLESLSVMYRTKDLTSPSSTFTSTGITPNTYGPPQSNNEGTILAYATSATSATIMDSKRGTYTLPLSGSRQYSSINILRDNRVLLIDIGEGYKYQLYEEGVVTNGTFTLPNVGESTASYSVDLDGGLVTYYTYTLEDTTLATIYTGLYVSEDYTNFTKIW